jgi:nucleotide-binding universal stress UspA family protein
VTNMTGALPVIAGVDASEHAKRAALWAGAAAAERGAALHLIHALDFDPAWSSTGSAPDDAAVAGDTDDGLLARLASQVQAAHPGLVVTCTLVDAAAPGALVAASADAGLLVVGSRGRGGFAGLPLGSVSLRVVAHAHCPTVVVRARGHEDARTGYIALGMEHDEPESAVLFAFTEAQRAGVALHAVRSWAPYPAHSQSYLSDTDILARQAAHDVTIGLKDMRERFPDVQVKIIVERGHASAVLSNASLEARLTVVGAHHHRGPLSLGVGPIIQGLLIDARSPVAVVPEA